MPTLRMGPTLNRLKLTPSDASLLGRFADDGDEWAFAELVRRHGPLVLGICRRWLTATDADDAFQATFLVLARKAEQVRNYGNLAGWLAAVAIRTAKCHRRTLGRRYRRERLGSLPDVEQQPDLPDADAVRLLLDEVAKLTDPLRSAVVLCDLQGVSRSAAAEQLGIPEGTLSSRLTDARKRLAGRLRGRVTVAVLVTVGVPGALAARVREVVSASAVPSMVVLELTEAMMRTGTWKLPAAVSVGLMVLAVGFAAGGPPQPQPVAKPANAPAEGQLILAFDKGVKYIRPSTGEVLESATKQDVMDAGAKLWSQFAIPGGVTMNIFMPRGRISPDGRISFDDKRGLGLFKPGMDVSLVSVPYPEEPGRFRKLYPVAWSPDGRYGVTTETRNTLWEREHFHHERFDTQTGEVTQLPLPDTHAILDWSADGEWYLTRREYTHFGLSLRLSAGTSLCRVSRDGKTTVELLSTREKPGEARFSPDGRTVAVCDQLEGKSGHRLRLIDATDGRVLATVPNDFPRFFPAWSPDGQQVATFGYREVKGKKNVHILTVLVYDLRTGQERVAFTASTKDVGFVQAFDWR